ncbi:MAG TPA: DHHA1 domain-containing protein [Pyrinomonadaceae bacterium]|jgi:alanyl-tRNA synthetase|nr:DHHA1 domain-containing protein [Pyrinomonadaceae bacterium]
MNTTERLYYADSHLKEFDARVVSVAQAADGRTGVTLDRTAFYPTGGGQPSDTGALNDARVVECVDEEESGVLHILEGANSLAVGASVRGRVDWERRRDHLQQHTGQHILSQAFVKLFDAETRGFRMSQHVSEIDVALGEPSDARIEEAVALANRIIWENRPLVVRQVTAEEAAALPLRKDSAREGELRIIEIEDFDMSPCGGTHAKRTGEVGVVAVRSWERAKGLTRLEFVAGNRAHADYRLANTTARGVAALFSVGRDESVAAVERLLEEHKQLVRRTRALEELAAKVEAAELLEGAARRESDGARIVARIFEGRDAETLRRLAHAIVAHAQTVALVAALEGDNARLVFARAAGVDADMNALMRAACAPHGWRGGGRPDMAQGGGRADAAQLAAVIRETHARLIER